jgi:heptosyltransferase-3
MLKDKIPLEQINNALVIKLRHHGDVLLSSPVFSVLKAHAPHVRVDALVYAETAAMLTGHPAIDTVYSLDRRWRQLGVFGYLGNELALLMTLRRRHYDLIIHLTDHPRGAWISHLCQARWAVTRKVKGRGRWWQSAFTHFFSTPSHALRHTSELHLDALRRIGVYPAESERRLFLAPGADAELRLDSLLTGLAIDGGRFIHIHPASRWYFKCWPVEKMAALIDRLHSDGHQVVLSAAPDAAEMQMIEDIQRRLQRPAHSLAGQLSLKELAALTARARLFIGVDSAPMHIAAAMRTPVVALFGPSGDKEWGPWKVAHRVVASEVHFCRPCGMDGCGGSKVSDCLVSLPVDKVFAAVQELLAQ